MAVFLADDELPLSEAVFVRPVPFFRDEAPPLNSKRVLLKPPSDAGVVVEWCIAGSSPNFRRRCGNRKDGRLEAAATSTVSSSNVAIVAAIVVMMTSILILFVAI